VSHAAPHLATALRCANDTSALITDTFVTGRASMLLFVLYAHNKGECWWLIRMQLTHTICHNRVCSIVLVIKSEGIKLRERCTGLFLPLAFHLYSFYYSLV
jgi:hypothetical protein